MGGIISRPGLTAAQVQQRVDAALGPVTQQLGALSERLNTAEGGISSRPTEAKVRDLAYNLLVEMGLVGGGSFPAPVFSPTSVSVPATTAQNVKIADVTPVLSGEVRGELTPADGRFVWNTDKSAVLRGSTAISEGTASVSFSSTKSGITRTATLPIVITGANTVPAPTVSPTSVTVDNGSVSPLAGISALPPNTLRTIDQTAYFELASNSLAVQPKASSPPPNGTYQIKITDTPSGGQPVYSFLAVVVQAAGTVPAARAEKLLYSWRVTGRGEAAGTIMTGGSPLNDGDLNAAEQLSVRRADGTKCLTQTDRDSGTFWPSGTSRFVPFHYEMPLLADGAFEEFQMWREPKAAVTPLSFATLAAFHTASYVVANGSNTTTVNALEAGSDTPWFGGPLVVSSRKRFDLPRAVVGAGTNVRLCLDRILYKDGSMHLDFQFENMDTYRALQGNAIYTATLTAGSSNTQRQNFSVAKQALYTKFSRQIRLNRDGSVRNDYPAGHRAAALYFSRTGMMSNLDIGLGLGPNTRAAFIANMAAADWNTPMATRASATYMPGTGGNDQIGETTLANAAMAVSGDPLMAKYAHDQSEAYDTVPWHMWHPEYNAYVNVVNRPLAYTVGAGWSGDSITKSQDTVWTYDTAHMGDPHFLVYMMSARRSRLDSLHAQAAWAVTASYPQGFARGNMTEDVTGDLTPAGVQARLAYLRAGGAKGVDVHNGEQVRAGSWRLRQMQELCCVLPASEHPYGDLFFLVVNNTRAVQESRRLALKESQGPNIYGLLDRCTYGDANGEQAPWQFMFRGSMDVKAARMKLAHAQTWIVEMYQHYFFNSMMDHQSSDGIYAGADGSGYNLQFHSGEFYDYLDGRSWKREWYDMARDGRGNNYGRNFANVAVDTQGDWQQRASSMAAELYNLLVDLNLDTTLAKQAMACMAEWPVAKTLTSENNFKENPRLTTVINGTTRSGGPFGPQMPAGAVKPSTYPIVDPYPYSAPKLKLSAIPTLTLGRDIPVGSKIAEIPYTGATPTTGNLIGNFYNYFEVRNGNQLYVSASMSGLELKSDYRFGVQMQSAINFDSVQVSLVLTTGSGGALTPGGGGTPTPLVAPSTQNYSLPLNTPAGQKIGDVVITSGGPVTVATLSGTNATTDYEIRNGTELYTKKAFDSYAVGAVRTASLAIQNASGGQATVALNITVAAAAGASTSIYATTGTTHLLPADWNEPVVQGYTGPLARLTKNGTTFYDLPSTDAVNAFTTYAAGVAVYVADLYIQDGTGRKYSQATFARMPRIMVSSGSLGLSLTTSGGRWLDSPEISVPGNNLGAASAVLLTAFGYTNKYFSFIETGASDEGGRSSAILLLLEGNKVAIRSKDDFSGQEEVFGAANWVADGSRNFVASRFRTGAVPKGYINGETRDATSFWTDAAFTTGKFRIGSAGTSSAQGHNALNGLIFAISAYTVSSDADVAVFRARMKTKHTLAA